MPGVVGPLGSMLGPLGAARGWALTPPPGSPVAWHAARATGLLNGSLVASAPDLTGHGWALTASADVLYGTNRVNGLPSYLNGGGGDQLANFAFPTQAAGISAFLVFQLSTSFAVESRVFGVNFYRCGNSPANGPNTFRAVIEGVNWGNSSGITADGLWRIALLQQNGDTLGLYLNGSATPVSVITGTPPTAHELVWLASAQAWAEGIVYGTVLAGEDLAAVWSYLNGIYGLY